MARSLGPQLLVPVRPLSTRATLLTNNQRNGNEVNGKAGFPQFKMYRVIYTSFGFR